MFLLTLVLLFAIITIVYFLNVLYFWLGSGVSTWLGDQCCFFTKKEVKMNPSRGLSVRSLHVLIVPMWVLSGYFLPQSRHM